MDETALMGFHDGEEKKLRWGIFHDSNNELGTLKDNIPSFPLNNVNISKNLQRIKMSLPTFA
jgi:hypothetical protein